MTSAVTVMAINLAPAPIAAGVLAKAAASMQPEVKSGAPPAALAKVPNPSASTASKPAQIGVQVSSALLGLSVTRTANSATAPDTQPPGTISATATLAAYTEFAVSAPASSQGADNEAGGSSGSEEPPDSGEQEAPASQTYAGPGTAQSASTRSTSGTPGAAGSSRGPASAQHHIAYPQVPIIPRWHIMPRARTA